MASFSKLIVGIALSSLIVSCGETGGVAPLSGSAFDYSICDTIVTTDLDSAGFNALLESGTSSNYFTACIEDGVTISDSMAISLSSDYVAIVGVSRTGSVVHGISYSKSSASGGIALTNLTMYGSGFSESCLSATNSTSGTTTVAISKVTCNSSGVGDSGRAYNFSSSSGSNMVFVVENSTIASQGGGIGFTISSGGTMTGNIQSNTFSVAATGIQFSQSTNSTMEFNLSANKFRYDGAANPGSFAVSSIASTNGGITVNNTSSGSNNFACNVSGSAGTFSGVYETSASSGAWVNGTFTAAGTQNGGQSVGTCP